MSIESLLRDIRQLPEGAPLDWRRFREEIHAAHDKAATTEERVTLLELHRLLMDQVERALSDPDEIRSFKEVRRQDYRLLLIKECTVGGNISPAAMATVTEREVAAGRMPEDDEFRSLGKVGAILKRGAMEVTEPGHEAHDSLLKRIASWLRLS